MGPLNAASHACVAVAEAGGPVRPLSPGVSPERASSSAAGSVLRRLATLPAHSLMCVCVGVALTRGAIHTAGTRGRPTPPTPSERACGGRTAPQPSQTALPPHAGPLLAAGSCPAPRPAARTPGPPPPVRCRRALTPGQQQEERPQQGRQPGSPPQPAHGAAVAARSSSGAAPRPASGAELAGGGARPPHWTTQPSLTLGPTRSRAAGAPP